MVRAERTQVDGLQDEYSALSALNCSEDLPDGKPNEDRARQEFKKETDINEILRRFGVGDESNLRQGTFGEIDYNLDLQQALSSIDQAKSAYREMPNELQRRYPTWQRFLNAIERGELTLHATDPQQTIVPPEQAPITVAPTKPQD